MKFLVRFDLEFDLKFEISDGKIRWNFGGGLFYLPGKHETFRDEFRRKIRKLRFKFRDFFGSFVQQKGGAKELWIDLQFLQTYYFENLICEIHWMMFVGPATTQNLVVKFDGEICGGVLVENVSDDFPSKRSSKISFQTSPEVRHQFRRKLRQLHSGNRWCLCLFWGEESTGNVAKWRLLVNPYRPAKYKINFVDFLGQSDLNSETEKSGVSPANQTRERSVHELFAGALKCHKIFHKVV